MPPEDDERDQRRQRLHQDDGPLCGERAEYASDENADEKEGGDRAALRRERPGQARREEAVVEPLIGRERRGLGRLLLGEAERAAPEWPGPQKHLEHEKPDVPDRDHSDEHHGRRGHHSFPLWYGSPRRML